MRGVQARISMQIVSKTVALRRAQQGPREPGNNASSAIWSCSKTPPPLVVAYTSAKQSAVAKPAAAPLQEGLPCQGRGCRKRTRTQTDIHTHARAHKASWEVLRQAARLQHAWGNIVADPSLPIVANVVRQSVTLGAPTVQTRL